MRASCTYHMHASQLQDMVLERLKLLNYEKDFCRRKCVIKRCFCTRL